MSDLTRWNVGPFEGGVTGRVHDPNGAWVKADEAEARIKEYKQAEEAVTDLARERGERIKELEAQLEKADEEVEAERNRIVELVLVRKFITYPNKHKEWSAGREQVLDELLDAIKEGQDAE
jgi:multidrug efflux pump subunit AcrA (membrane-fusion protein)